MSGRKTKNSGGSNPDRKEPLPRREPKPRPQNIPDPGRTGPYDDPVRRPA